MLKRKHIITLCLSMAVIMIFTSMVFGKGLDELSEKDKKKIARGKVVVWSSGDSDNGMSRFEGIVIIDRPVSKVWEALTDFENWPGFLPSYVEATMLERTKLNAKVEFVIRYKRLNGRVVSEITLDADEFTIKADVVESHFNISKADKTATLEFGRSQYVLKELDANTTLMEVSNDLKVTGVQGGTEVDLDERRSLIVLKRHIEGIKKMITKAD